MSQFVYNVGDDELIVESDYQTIYGTETTWDSSWRKRDNNGHWHFFGSDEDKFPTLFSRMVEVYDAEDEWQEERWYCKECQCRIVPDTISKQVVREVKNYSRYTLKTVREVTEEEARAWMNQKQAEMNE